MEIADFNVNLGEQIFQIGNEKYPLNVEENYTKFVFDKKDYLLLFVDAPMRKHTNLFIYEDILESIPVIISKQNFDKWLKWAASIYNNVISIPQVDKIPIDMVFEEFKNFILEHKDDVMPEHIKLLESVMTNYVSNIEEINKLCFVNDFAQIEMKSDCIEDVFVDLKNFIERYNAYLQPQIMSISNTLYFYNVLLNLAFIIMITTSSSLFITKNILIGHILGCVLIDIITDRNGKELFIKKANEKAVEILQFYYKEFPILRKIQNPNDLIMINPIKDNLQEFDKKQKIQMLPNILTYNMSDYQRIETLYTSFVKGVEGDVFNKLPEFNQFYQKILKPLIIPKSVCGFYDTSAIIPHLLTMIELDQK